MSKVIGKPKGLPTNNLVPAGVTLVVALVVAVTLAVAALLIIQVDREADIKAAEREMENASTMLAEQVRQAFMAADLILDAVANKAATVDAKTPGEFREKLADRGTYDQLVAIMQGLPQIDVTTVVDVDGNVVNFSRSYPPPQINLADRDYFAAPTQGNSAGLFVSLPGKNRGTGEWTFYLSRAIRNGDGDLVGLVLTGLKPGFFEDFFRRSGAGLHVQMSIFRDDGILLARYPRSEAAMGASYLESPAFRVLREKPQGGVTRTSEPRISDPADASFRLVAPRPVPDLPLVTNISSNLDVILANWQWRAQRTMGIMLLAIAVVAGLGIVAFGLMKSRERVLDALVSSKRAVEEALQAKSRFLSAMTHEIRTPMNAVLGIAGVLMDAPLKPAQREQVRLIRESGDLLLRIIDDILDLNRLDAGKVEIENIEFDPRAITRDTAALLATQAKAKGLQVVTEFGDIPGRATGDPSRIRQILFNLLGNAIKFTDAGSVRISAMPGGVDRPGVEWTVRDTGVGIAPDRIKLLFSEFVQADNSISRRFGGSGLGLAICKRLVDLMGSEIGVESVPGQGTTVRFFLPLASASGTSERIVARASAESELVAALSKYGRSVRLLVAEDNDTNQLVLRSLLSVPGLEVEMVCNGLEAIAALDRQSFDMVLMDVQMPMMDGLTATRKLREGGGDWSRLPVIAFTANAFADDRAACQAAGMTDFVAKPVRKEALFAAILRNLPMVGRLASEERFPIAPKAEEGTDADAGALARLCQDVGQEAGAQVLRSFLIKTDNRLAALRESIDDRGMAMIEVHALKGAARLVGAARLGERAAALEKSVGAGNRLAIADIDELADLLAAFKRSSVVCEVLGLTGAMDGGTATQRF